ncbi:MAG: DUF4142 domain-containing protein [Chitinophagaceae bacterium]
MKRIYQEILKAGFVVVSICTTGMVHGQDKDPVKAANASNEKKADAKMVDADVAEFLVKSADARMMGGEEGKLATQKGTTAAVRAYGQLMIKDQAMLLKKIRVLASELKISLPNAISEDKQDGKKDLMEKTGKDFDEKFKDMMKIDHERDVKLFKKATEYGEPRVAAFAVKYLPLIQSHLDKVNKLPVK